MSEQEIVESESVTEPLAAEADGETAKAESRLSFAKVWVDTGKLKLSGALQWLAQGLTKASAGLGVLATRVDAAGSALVATE